MGECCCQNLGNRRSDNLEMARGGAGVAASEGLQ
jgi:hypothetical protein